MPKLLKTPFAIDAAEGFRTDIQESTGAAPNSATYQVGFPPVTMQSIASNGMPPKGSDLNGVLYDITDNLVFLTQGGGYGFDAAYATSIGGYPLNARLRLTNGDIVRSIIDGNTVDPNVDLTGWDFNYKKTNVGVFTNPSVSKLEKLAVGEIFETSGYYENGDNGSALYLVKSGNVTENSYSFNIDDSKHAELIAARKNRLEQYGIILSSKNTNVLSLIDYSDNFQDAFNHANSISFNYGIFKITKTINVARSLVITGFFHNSVLFADMPTKNTAIFNVVTDGAVFNNFVCRGNTSRNGEFAVFSGTVGVPSYAANNKFNFIRCENISLFNRFTTTNPLNGLLHAMGSENLFYGCKVYNCDKYIIAENTQSVNNWWRSCDFERDDASDNSSQNYIEDFAGSGLNFDGGSIIGKGTPYIFEYPELGINLFPGGNLLMRGIRFECRGEHSGFLIKQGTNGKVDVSLYHKLVLDNCSILADKKISVLSYCGRIIASIKDITSVNGLGLTINQFPTIGASTGSMELGSFGSVVVTSSDIELVKEDYSPYGIYNETYTGSCSIESVLPRTTNQTSYIDSDGFIVNQHMPANQLGLGVNHIRENTFAFGFDGSNTRLETTPYLFKLSKGMRLRRIGFTKMQDYRGSEIIAKIYFVKDKANWAGATFNIENDAILLSQVSCPVGKVGYFESLISTDNNLNTNASVTGFGGWRECRIALLLNTQTTGVFTIDYI